MFSNFLKKLNETFTIFCGRIFTCFPLMDAAGPTQADVSVHLRKSGAADAIDARHGQGNILSAKLIHFVDPRPEIAAGNC